jgi:hypothetical protein
MDAEESEEGTAGRRVMAVPMRWADEKDGKD